MLQNVVGYTGYRAVVLHVSGIFFVDLVVQPFVVCVAVLSVSIEANDASFWREQPQTQQNGETPNQQKHTPDTCVTMAS
jgi:hypothetical protein